jgi:hypothetical protein
MTLRGFERRWLCAIFATMLPSGAEPRLPLGADDVDSAAYIDDLMRVAPRHFALGLRACAWLIQLLPLFVLRKPATFMGLPVELRTELFERMCRSDVYLIRELPMLFKTAACLGYCGLPQVQALVGIAPRDAEAARWARRRLPGLPTVPTAPAVKEPTP